MLQEPGLQSILPSHSLSLPWLQRAGVWPGLQRPFFLQALNSKQLFFSHLSCETQTSPALQKHLFRLSKTVIFPRCSYETQRSPALQKTHFSGSMFFRTALMKLRQAWLCKKTTFQALKFFFLLRCSYETQRSPALPKNNFSGSKKLFSSYVSCQICQLHLVAGFSSLQSAQMHTKHNSECSKNFRDPRPIVVEICMHLNLKNKNLRDPGPQAFGFLTNSRAVVFKPTYTGWWFTYPSEKYESQLGL